MLDYLAPSAPPAAPAGGRTAQLAARVVDLLLAQGLPLPRHALPRSAFRVPTSAAPAPSGSLRLPGARRFWWAYLLAGLGLVALLLRLGTVLAGTLADPLTTWQYGEVRTTHLRVFFGLPGETSTSPSLLTATNDAGTGHVWLLPAGEAAQGSVLEIPVTDVDPAGKQPLHLSVADVDRDGHPDLLVTLGDSGPTYIYLFDLGKVALRPPTADEQRRLFLPERAP
jgi:hypothetical protein